jgi:hypothetical protein
MPTHTRRPLPALPTARHSAPFGTRHGPKKQRNLPEFAINWPSCSHYFQTGKGKKTQESYSGAYTKRRTPAWQKAHMGPCSILRYVGTRQQPRKSRTSVPSPLIRRRGQAKLANTQYLQAARPTRSETAPDNASARRGPLMEFCWPNEWWLVGFKRRAARYWPVGSCEFATGLGYWRLIALLWG